MHSSSTQSIPSVSDLPRHIAVIMDGNGRWATRRHLPRTAGHIRGVRSVRRSVEFCIRNKIAYLTLFSFSSENWRRPKEEVSLLMKLFKRSLKKEVPRLHKHGVRLHVVGKLDDFDTELQQDIATAESLTADNTTLNLTIAANYGGRWDICNAIRQFASQHDMTSLTSLSDEQLESQFAGYLSMPWAPEPDLFIRTGGEQRISNFLIWQLAYTELYFTEILWPDFRPEHLQAAVQWYANRERRFGRISAQLQEDSSSMHFKSNPNYVD